MPLGIVEHVFMLLRARLAWARLHRPCSANTVIKILILFSFVVPLLPPAETTPFRFAWLSDTHVGSTTGQEDLRAAVRDINSMTGLSFVILSGDVTEYGSREQLRLARELLDGLKIPC